MTAEGVAGHADHAAQDSVQRQPHVAAPDRDVGPALAVHCHEAHQLCCSQLQLLNAVNHAVQEVIADIMLCYFVHCGSACSRLITEGTVQASAVLGPYQHPAGPPRRPQISCTACVGRCTVPSIAVWLQAATSLCKVGGPPQHAAVESQAGDSQVKEQCIVARDAVRALYRKRLCRGAADAAQLLPSTAFSTPAMLCRAGLPH